MTNDEIIHVGLPFEDCEEDYCLGVKDERSRILRLIDERLANGFHRNLRSLRKDIDSTNNHSANQAYTKVNK